MNKKLLVIFMSLIALNQAFAADESKGLCSSLDESYCVGSQVIAFHKKATINAIFQDGSVSVKYFGEKKSERFDVFNVALRSGCTDDNFCYGDHVVTSKGVKGRISGIYPNGWVTVNQFLEPHHFTYSTSKLAVLRK